MSDKLKNLKYFFILTKKWIIHENFVFNFTNY